MKRKATGKPTGTWCSYCCTDVMCLEENGVEALHCQCSLGQKKTNLTMAAIVKDWWKGMIP